MAKFDPSQIKTPKPIAKQIGMNDQVGQGTRYAKFGGDRFTGVFWGDVHFLELSFFFYIYSVFQKK